MTKAKNRNELFVASCRDMSHQMVVSTCNNSDNIYISIHLNRPAFFKRIGTAFRYVFGKPSRYGDFDDVVLKKYEAERLRNTIDRKLTELDNCAYGKRRKAKQKQAKN